MGKQPLQIKLVVSPDAKPFTADIAARALFGMSQDELIRAMQENRNGEFDSIYAPVEKDQAVQNSGGK